ncbi:condensin complex subunit 2 [Aureococcus anophagefferens]|nr:condensin complex subunit 2 [Aureococcus anophagefferens]
MALDEEAAPAPKLANKNRRRSGARRSFGGRKSGGGKGKPIEDLSPEDVAAMYSTTLKMAAVDDRENKITAKNAWSLPLIDHMRDVVREEDEGGDEGKKNPKHNKPRKIFNFTRASCTLEAGVKIYSSRVDDTLNTSYRVLESLHRGKTKGGESDDEESEDEDDAPLEGEEAVPKKRKARKAATHADASATLGTSAQIDAAAVRAAKTAAVEEDDRDAFFSRISRGGGGSGLVDGGSARAMLLQRLAADAACVSFGDGDADDDDDGEDAVVSVIPFKNLLPRSVLPPSVCPPLAALRREVADAAAGGDAGAYPAGDDGHDDGGDAPAFFGGDDDGDDDYPDVDDDCGLGDEGIENTLVDAFALGGGALGRPALAAGEAQREAATAFALQPGALAGADEMSYFDAAALKNAWAGVAHWKAAAPGADGDAAAAKKPAPKKAKKTSSSPPSRRRRAATPAATAPRRRQTTTAPWRRRRAGGDDYDDCGGPEDDADDGDRFAIPDDDEENYGRKTSFAGRPTSFAGRGTSFGGSLLGPELLACGRVVDKINISFATRAKKVDVRQLKTQMWRQVEEEPETDFASLVADVAGKQKQADVTMPFYFICLLHLCNEKTLKLETPDGADINNFSISTQG